MSYWHGSALCDESMAKVVNRMFEELLTMFEELLMVFWFLLCEIQFFGYMKWSKDGPHSEVCGINMAKGGCNHNQMSQWWQKTQPQMGPLWSFWIFHRKEFLKDFFATCF